MFSHLIDSALRLVAVSDLILNAILLYILFLIRQNHRANVFLAQFVICYSSLLVFFIADLPGRMVLTFLSCLVGALMAVSGSFIYLYMCLLSGDIASIGKKELKHLIPFPVVFSAELVLHFPLDPVTQSPRFPLASSLVGLGLVILPTVYIVFTFMKIHGYEQRVENWFSDVEKVSMGWLKAITIPALALFFIWTLVLFLIFFKIAHWGPALILPQLIIIGIIPLIAIFYVIRQPEIFKANREIVISALEMSAHGGDSKEKYAKQSIDENLQAEYCEKLLSCMEMHKPYLEEDITIRQLSDRIDVPMHQLSIVINSLLGKNFSAFINEYRIKEAVSFLNNDIDANILSVAFRSGFSSKSSFNNTFKKVTGKTPSRYRAELRSISRNS